MPKQARQRKLMEGLRTGDLRNYVSEVFTIDRFKSKMGEDADTVVLAFHVKEKYPAIDLMEFIEKGYGFVLDADMSAGEEQDGKYQVFVEIERTSKLPGQLRELMGGISQLTDCYDWRFKYQKSSGQIPFSEQKITEHVPMTSEAYEKKLLEIKNNSINKFFSEGALDGVTLESDGTMTFQKPFFGNLKMKFVAVGRYDDIKEQVPGALSLDENGQSQVYFLQKYLGNYDIDKIGDKFLIRNGNKAMLVQKDSW